MNRFARTLVAIIVLALAGRSAIAQDRATSMKLTRLSRPITLDGIPDDAAWKEIAPLPLTLYAPVFRGTPSQQTEIRVAYDDENFYVAAWCFDTEPSGIRVNSLYRDRWSGDDAVAIYIDAFNDKHNSKWFGITASGVRFDQLVSDDGATLNGSWDTFWFAETTINDKGWFAEVRIPFSSLGFRSTATGDVVMGLTVTRLLARRDERVTFPSIDPKFDFRRPSVAQEIALEGVRTRTPLYVTPYALGGAQRSTSPVVGGFHTATGESKEAGLDVRYPLSSNLTLDVTYNTDFAQAEADDQQVNLDRFPLFFPERRRFFQEGSGIFDFTAGTATRLFHSRRIGINAAGQAVPVLGGARLVGRIGAWDTGILGMRTDRQGATPGETFGVLRFRRQLLNENSTAGMMVTAYDGGGHTNLGVGGDALFRLHGDDYAGVKYIVTADNSDTAGSNAWHSGLLDLRYERRSQRGLQLNASSTHSGRDFHPELGFQQRRDFTTANIVGNYFIYTDSNRYFRRVYPGALAFTTRRNSDGVVESAQYAVWVEWDTKAGGGGWIEPKAFHENVTAEFPIGKATVPAGSYDFADLQLVYSMAAGARLRTSIDARAGTYFDGTRAQVIASPTWNVSPHLELGGDYQRTKLRFASRGQTEDIQLARLRVRTAIDASKSGSAFVQYSSVSNRLDLNVRLRYAFAEGTDLWIVYNEGLDTDRYDPTLAMFGPRSLSRTLIVKYSHTFAF